MKVSRRWFLGVAALAPLVQVARFDENDEIEIDEVPATPPALNGVDRFLSFSAYGYSLVSEPTSVRVFNEGRLLLVWSMNAHGGVVRYVPEFGDVHFGSFTMHCDSPNVQLEMCLRRGDRRLVSTRRPGMTTFLTLDVDSMQIQRAG